LPTFPKLLNISSKCISFTFRDKFCTKILVTLGAKLSKDDRLLPDKLLERLLL
jgi:hypothetical protein